MEHLNRRLKGVIRNLGANQTKKAINRASKCIGVVDNICQATDSELSNKYESGHHPVPKYGKDLSSAVEVLAEAKLFSKLPKRRYRSFHFKRNLFETCPKDNLTEWLLTHIGKTIQL